MLVILILIASFIIGSLLMCKCGECGELVGSLINIFTIIILILVLIAGISNYMSAGADKEAAIEKYNAIQYKVSSEAYKDDIGLLNKDVIDEICEWNSDLKWKQKMTHSAFVGALMPNYYDDLEFIELPDK